MSDELKVLAERIVRDLFTDGAGEHAERLVLTLDGPPRRDLGGWSAPALVVRIMSHLRDSGVRVG